MYAKVNNNKRLTQKEVLRELTEDTPLCWTAEGYFEGRNYPRKTTNVYLFPAIGVLYL